MWDLVILAAAAGTARFTEMRTLAGFCQALVWAGGVGAIIGGMAAFAQWLLARMVPGSDAERDDRHGLVPAAGGALGSGDATMLTY